MKTKTVITIAHQEYEFVKTPVGKDSCSLCALSLLCFDSYQDPPCIELTQSNDWHFIKKNV